MALGKMQSPLLFFFPLHPKFYVTYHICIKIEKKILLYVNIIHISKVHTVCYVDNDKGQHWLKYYV